MLPAAEAYARHREKRSAALLWLARWHYSTAELISRSVGIRNTAFISAMKHDGLIRQVTRSPLHRLNLLMLTREGVLASTTLDPSIYDYNVSQLAINHRTVVHRLATQMAVLKHGKIVEIFTPDFRLGAVQPGYKLPDCVLELPIDQSTFRVAIEVQLSMQDQRTLHLTYLRHAAQLSSGGYDGVIYYSHNQDLLARMERILHEPHQAWHRDERGVWIKRGHPTPMNDKLKFSFQFVRDRTFEKLMRF